MPPEIASPEANPVQVAPDAPLDRGAVRQQAMERAAAALVESGTPSDPEAGAGTGDSAGGGAETPSGGQPADPRGGGAPSDGSPEGEPGASAGEPDPEAEEVPTDPAVFKDWLAERDARLEAQHKERMKGQKDSLLGSFNKEKQQLMQSKLLEELDDLDDDELAERVKKDPNAALALATRAHEGDATVKAAAQQVVTQHTIPRIFAAAAAIKEAGGPDLVQIAEERGEDWEAITQKDNSFFDWLVEQSMEVGGKSALEKFKKSPEYRTAIADARAEGRRDALGDLGTPPSDEGVRRPPTNQGPEPEDPRQRALARAGRQTNTPVDLSLVASRRRRA